MTTSPASQPQALADTTMCPECSGSGIVTCGSGTSGWPPRMRHEACANCNGTGRILAARPATAAAGVPEAYVPHANAAAIVGINSALFRLREGKVSEAIAPLESAVAALAAQTATQPASDALLDKHCVYCAGHADAPLRHAKHLAYLWATSARDTQRWQDLYEATERAIDAIATPAQPASEAVTGAIQPLALQICSMLTDEMVRLHPFTGRASHGLAKAEEVRTNLVAVRDVAQELNRKLLATPAQPAPAPGAGKGS